MPHLIVEYSANAEEVVDFSEFCGVLRLAAIETGVFAIKGVRVRAIRCDHFAIADGSPENCFIDISVRLRGGRSLQTKRKAVEHLFEACRSYLANAFGERPLALSMEMRDIDPELSPKESTIVIEASV